MSRRKYIEIADIVEKANQYFQVSPQAERLGRRMLASFVEGILHDTDTYNGFRYLGPTEVKDGYLPGIIFDETEARNHVYPDESRVSYSFRR